MREYVMPADQNNLIWIDMEMTGLTPDSDRILEVALLVTDAQLNVVAESPVLVVHQPDEVLAAMDSWNTGVHGKSGLVAKTKASRLDEAAVQARMLEFLARWMPRLEAYFHYRNLDVSTLKELVKRWKPEVAKGLKKEGKHEALADILDSIEELKYYRRTVMTI